MTLRDVAAVIIRLFCFFSVCAGGLSIVNELLAVFDSEGFRNIGYLVLSVGVRLLIIGFFVAVFIHAERLARVLVHKDTAPGAAGSWTIPQVRSMLCTVVGLYLFVQALPTLVYFLEETISPASHEIPFLTDYPQPDALNLQTIVYLVFIFWLIFGAPGLDRIVKTPPQAGAESPTQIT